MGFPIIFQVILDTIQAIRINCCFIIVLQWWALLQAYAGNKTPNFFFQSDITLNGKITMDLSYYEAQFHPKRASRFLQTSKSVLDGPYYVQVPYFYIACITVYKQQLYRTHFISTWAPYYVYSVFFFLLVIELVCCCYSFFSKILKLYCRGGVLEDVFGVNDILEDTF